MTTITNVLQAAFIELTRSDAIGPAPSRWHFYLADQMAHCLMGLLLGLYPVPRVWLWAFALGWIGKELCFDIPNGGADWLVIADSVADLSFGALGYIIAKSRMEAVLNGRN